MDYLNRLKELQDEKYGAFQAKLIPNIDATTIIGVRTPALRSLAKKMKKEMGEEELKEFLAALPHTWFEEMQLHAFLLSEWKEFDSCVKEVDGFLEYVDNWATCDQLSPKIFKKQKAKLLPYIKTWIDSGHPYKIRFGIKMLMDHFLNEDFQVEYAEIVAAVRSEEYYVNMMIAWYFATALAKQYDSILPFLEEKKLDRWSHNKAIQKARESYRITPEQKEYLKTLKC